MGGVDDCRNIRWGLEIPTETYSDQPYLVQTDDGAWLCILTTGAGHEGQSGQHVVTLRSTDRGNTWADRADVEPADGPDNGPRKTIPRRRRFCSRQSAPRCVPEPRRPAGTGRGAEWRRGSLVGTCDVYPDGCEAASGFPLIIAHYPLLTIHSASKTHPRRWPRSHHN